MIHAEARHRSDAISAKGAIKLMQVMPATGRVLVTPTCVIHQRIFTPERPIQTTSITISNCRSPLITLVKAQWKKCDRQILPFLILLSTQAKIKRAIFLLAASKLRQILFGSQMASLSLSMGHRGVTSQCEWRNKELGYFHNHCGRMRAKMLALLTIKVPHSKKPMMRAI
ncbi:lytic transglycosylase domain-containing protein [Pseudomonas chlororaphis]|uniref:lytic transglycosylase domain-containing protein n=1 Tax=Pseudomonas chlororaphis TaxID=587753 RepID=UPI003B97AF79